MTGDAAGDSGPDVDDLPAQIATIMRGFAPPWFITGGWAVDLYVGRVTRAHADIEIAIFRRDQFALQDHLRAWRWEKVVGGKRLPWPRGDWLELPLHELYGVNEQAEPRQLEVLLNESAADAWVYRRDANITRPLSKCYLTSRAGVKFLAPEIVLLYKSKYGRALDEQDFAAVGERLEPERRAWLRAALATGDAAHPWLNRL